MFKKALAIVMAFCLALSLALPSFAADATPALDASNISVFNNIKGTPDKFQIGGVVEGDIIKVYASATSASPIAVRKSEGTNAHFYVEQLGEAEGTIYVTLTSAGKTESSRTAKGFEAEPGSTAPVAGNITVTNNISGIFDTVEITGLTMPDTVRVYTSASATTPIASGRVLVDGTIVLYIEQLGAGAGSVYVTVKNDNLLESTRTAKAYNAETGTTALTAGQITVTNNVAGTPDTVAVTGVLAADVINVYATASSTYVIGTATVLISTTSATVSIDQIGIPAGKVYVTVKKSGANESARTEASYTSEITPTLLASAVTVTNNYVTSADTIVITGLTGGDEISAYATATSTPNIGFMTVPEGDATATITKDQLGSAAGKVYVTHKKANKAESARLAVSYIAEPSTTAPSASGITVTNNITGTNDTVYVTGIAQFDVVNVYATATSKTPIGTATVQNNYTDVTVSINQIGVAAGKVYVTVKNETKLESARTAKEFSAEAGTPALAADKITVTNNAGADDTVVVEGLLAGDEVNVYTTATSTTAKGTASVPTDQTSATVTIDQLGTAAGKVYVTVKKSLANESPRTAVSYTSETTTTLPAASVKVTNNYVIAKDTILVTGLTAGDFISVYQTATSTPALKTDTVAEGADSVTIELDQLTSAAGKIYVSVKKQNKAESARTAVSYLAEPATPALADNAITVTNNITNIDDIVAVGGLAPGDIINVYATASSTAVLGTETVAEGGNSVSISIKQIGIAAGKIYVTVKKSDSRESARTAKAFIAEVGSTALVVGNIKVTNNAGKDDTVEVTGLNPGDVVNVYTTSTATTVKGTAEVATDGNSATVIIEQLGTAAGKVYVAIKNAGANESKRTVASYTSETSVAPATSKIVITNNYIGTNDTIVVSGLAAEDLVKVYASTTATETLGSGSVASEQDTATISIPQIGAAAGRVYVSVTKKDKAESTKTAVSFLSEPKSTALAASAINVTNKLADDTVVVTGLEVGDSIKVYRTSTSTEVLGSDTVASGTTATAIIPQLGTGAGTVYVTVKKATKIESARTAAKYTSETSVAPSAANILVINNKGTADTVTVAGLKAGDTVKIYDAATNGSVIGSAQVDAGTTGLTISINQLGTGVAGKIYVSVTSTDKKESSRVAKAYLAE